MLFFWGGGDGLGLTLAKAKNNVIQKESMGSNMCLSFKTVHIEHLNAGNLNEALGIVYKGQLYF